MNYIEIIESAILLLGVVIASLAGYLAADIVLYGIWIVMSIFIAMKGVQLFEKALISKGHAYVGDVQAENMDGALAEFLKKQAASLESELKSEALSTKPRTPAPVFFVFSDE